jgi:hypothetical protein
MEQTLDLSKCRRQMANDGEQYRPTAGVMDVGVERLLEQRSDAERRLQKCHVLFQAAGCGPSLSRRTAA